MPPPRPALLRPLPALGRRYAAHPVERVRDLRHPMLRGWGRSWAGGDAARGLGCRKDWGAKKGRRPLRRARHRQGGGGQRGRRRGREDPGRLLHHLAGAAAAAERAPRGRGPRTLPRQQAGKRRAGKPPAAFDVAGAGNVAMGALCTPRAIARARLATLHLKGARQFSTLPQRGA